MYNRNLMEDGALGSVLAEQTREKSCHYLNMASQALAKLEEIVEEGVYGSVNQVAFPFALQKP
jgi:hypothetical protein